VDPKEVVRRVVEDVITGGRLELIDELFVPDEAAGARAWIEPFRRAFPDVDMEIVELVAEGDRVAGRFKCSATQLGEWRGQAPTQRRFEAIDEVYFFTLRDGRVARMWGLEDTRERERQLGLGDRGG
jgi:predicted ester cyclase